jgi:hypothetical protein
MFFPSLSAMTCRASLHSRLHPKLSSEFSILVGLNLWQSISELISFLVQVETGCLLLFAPHVPDDADACSNSIEYGGSPFRKRTKSATKPNDIGMNTDGSVGRQAGTWQVEDKILHVQASTVTILGGGPLMTSP